MTLATPRAGGFVLVTTIWALAGLALLASYIDDVTAADVEAARLARQSVEGELLRRSTEATVLYLLATNRMDHRGILLEAKQRFVDEPDLVLPAGDAGKLTFSGETYAAFEGARFAIQEEGGLASVNAPESRPFAVALRYAGVDRAAAERIARRVADYIDTDHTLSLSGAERHDYIRRGRTPPPNWLMISPVELKKVLDVEAEIDAEAWRRLRPLLTSRLMSGYNFNTMPVEALAVNLGVPASVLDALLEARERQPISSLESLAKLTGKRLNIDPLLVSVYPSNNLRIATWREGSARRTVLGITLTPASRTAPWRTEYRYSEPLDDDSGIPKRPATPLLRSL